jgi:hypothetical protein
MRFSCKHKIIQVQYQIGWIGEQEKQVFECFRQDVRVHSVLVFFGAHIIDCSIAAGYFGMKLKCFQYFFANLKWLIKMCEYCLRNCFGQTYL